VKEGQIVNFDIVVDAARANNSPRTCLFKSPHRQRSMRRRELTGRPVSIPTTVGGWRQAEIPNAPFKHLIDGISC
jgi:hypothetical protein